MRAFCEAIGVAKRDAVVEMQLLEHFVREDLNKRAPRVMAVLHPLRLVIENYPEGQVEQLDAVNNPEDPSAGTGRYLSRAPSISTRTISKKIRRSSSFVCPGS